MQQRSFPFTHDHEKDLFSDQAQTSLLSTLVSNQFRSSPTRFLVSYSGLAKYFIPHPFPKIGISALQACNTSFPDSSTPHRYRCAKVGHRRVVRSKGVDVGFNQNYWLFATSSFGSTHLPLPNKSPEPRGAFLFFSRCVELGAMHLPHQLCLFGVNWGKGDRDPLSRPCSLGVLLLRRFYV